MDFAAQQALMEPLGKPPPFSRNEGEARLVVRSIGTAGAGMVRTLKHILPYPESQVAALLYQAPSELVVGLPRPVAEAMSRMLRDTGLESDVLDARESFDPGLGDHEVALVVHQVEHMGSIIQELVSVLGLDVTTARKMACASPAILLGRISSATVEALRKRFAPWGAELDASKPREALFDLFIVEGAAATRAAVQRALRDAGVPLTEDKEHSSKALVAMGLDAPRAHAIWERLQRTGTSLRLINRDFQRFEVVLEQARPSSALTDFLHRGAGIPPAVVPKLLERRPIVTHHNIPHAALGPCLEEFARLDCQVTARLLSFQTFSLELTEVRDMAATLLTLRVVADLDDARARSLLQALPARIEGPFTPLHARWLQYELKRIGTTARLVLR
ncbi:hypothetical protein JRI60_46075 [Archangium violaceum]|uniref:hypothetical protein n=1 Tax=Archangium violaceum TaxID=83451 RepID=UPI001950E4EB|nr:hypothetical protein [Archangium violaceum]QRN96309.1 hypothetical protein JRI60_46075 [Archangium violaceum]